MGELLSRKFLGFILVSGMLFVLVLVGKITGADFTTFITANLGLYLTANVGTKIADNVK